ncbi:MAG TPA: matrixin family metalloprotease [Thermoanaerobaculia bacterium]|nr:matrixin family metalloprotease [Thermoanaerobaculia bacterium]
MRRSHLLLFASLLAAPAALFGQQGDGETLTIMLSSNEGLRAQGMDYVVQQIDFFNRDGSRSSARYFQQEFRWVPGDPRRGSTGPELTYLFDTSWGDVTASGLDRSAVENAMSRAAASWAAEPCSSGVPLVRVSHTGEDVTVFDYLVAGGGFGDPFAADVTVAGFPAAMADFFGPNTLAFAVTFVFVDGSGEPTDIDGDRHLDTALNEIYLNPAFDWTLAAGGPGFDVETTALHELGHAIGLGHFGAPPESVMSPVYNGTKRSLYPIYRSALCVVHGRN